MPSDEYATSSKNHIWIETYGFVSWVVSYIALCVYVIWAFVPKSVLNHYGISHYPTQYWAVTAPLYFIVMVFAYLITIMFAGLGAAPDFDSHDYLRDEFHRLPLEEAELLAKGALPAAADIPLSVAQQFLWRGHYLEDMVNSAIQKDSRFSLKRP